MKKTISIVLVVLFVLPVFTACGAPASLAPSAPENSSDKSAGANSPSAAVSESAVPSESAASVESGDTSVFYNKYADMKGKAYDRLTAALAEKPEAAGTIALTLLPIASVDLYLIPLTVLSVGSSAESVSAASVALSMFGMADIKVNQDSGVWTITYTKQDADKKEKEYKQTCQYDAAADAMSSSVFDEKGKEEMFFEYEKIGNAYAAQYYYTDTNGVQLITAFFDDSNIVAFGLQKADKKPASIIKNTSLNEGFVKTAETYRILKDGKLLVHDNGKDQTF